MVVKRERIPPNVQMFARFSNGWEGDEVGQKGILTMFIPEEGTGDDCQMSL